MWIEVLIKRHSDFVVASPRAIFGLPETSVGVYAAAGGLPRLVRACGMQIAAEIAMANRKLSAQEAHGLNLVNKISRSPESLMEEAIELATVVAKQSPDALIVTRHGLRESWETASVERAVQLTSDVYSEALLATENRAIGLRAFRDKKTPQWVNPKL
jgi:enoyl-CoA hydratase/carnithine racemase